MTGRDAGRGAGVLSDAPPPGTRPATPEGSVGRGEAIAGGALVGLVVVAAVWFQTRPGPIFLDRWGVALIHPTSHRGAWLQVADLRSVPVLVGGSVLAALVAVGRDRWRALAVLVAPGLAVVLAEYLLKPAIGRRYAEVLTFPSGTTTVVGAVAMAWAVAAPRLLRPLVAVVGGVVVGLVCIAVVALQWHYPSDALAGAVFGAGIVLLVDGVLHLAVAAVRHPAHGPADP